MTTKRWACTAAAAALMLTATGCTVDRAGGTAAEQTVVLTFAQANRGDPAPQLTAWADEVKRLTGGSITIEFKNGWRLGESRVEASILDDVKAGKVDLAWVGPRVFDRVGVMSFQAMLAPMLVDSHDLQRAVFEAGIPKEMLAGLEKIDLVGVGVLPGPLRKVLGVTSTFVTPHDFVGKVVGIPDSALAQQTIEALGATMKTGPTSPSLDGMDAFDVQLGAITGNGYQQDAKSVTGNLNLWPRPFAIVAGKSVHASLTEGQQHALTQAIDNVLEDALVAARAEDEDNGAILCASALTMASVDQNGMAAFRKAFEPVYSSLRTDPTTAKFLQRIEALKASVGAPPDAVDCGRSSQSAGAIPNGTYQHPATKADIVRLCQPGDPTASHISRDVPVGGLTLQLVVNGERLVVSGFPTGHPEASEVGWTGTYRAYRETFELIEAGHKGLPLTWSWDGKQLQLTDWPLDGCDNEVVWTSHPWVKVDK